MKRKTRDDRSDLIFEAIKTKNEFVETILKWFHHENQYSSEQDTLRHREIRVAMENMIIFHDQLVDNIDIKYPIVEFFSKHVIGGIENPLMIRWNIINCKLFSIRIHKFLRSDHDCVHDHPWNFITLILKGGYYEKFEDGKMYWRKPGTLMFRRATHKHSVQLPVKTLNSILYEKDIHIPSYSLFISGPVIRKWGFWSNKIWTYWRKFNTNNEC